MIHSISTTEIRYGNDIVGVRLRSRQIAGLLGFDDMEQARVATAVSEIARNAFNYAGGGRVEFLIDDEAERYPLLSILVTDAGPGISDLEGVLAGRVCVPKRAGLGIISARRLMDHFHIESEPAKGTRVRLSKRFPPLRTPIRDRDLARIARELACAGPRDPLDDVRQQNQDLVRALDQLRTRQEELERLNRELEDTNRGVVALYAELDERASHLRQADGLKSRFLSNMSHEFRTPLNSILALARLLLDNSGGALTDEQVKQITFIQMSAQDLSALVNDLLDLAKVEAGRITVMPSEVSAASVFGGLRGMFRPLLTNPLVKLIFEDPSGVPRLYTDEGKVSQILRNFISNALKFTDQGQVVVSAAHNPDTGEVTFSVSDTGVGIAPEDQERIFSEFEQVETQARRRAKGTGLGLPLSKHLAELLGGRITLKSVPGEGSMFSLTIPAMYPGAVAAAGATAQPDATRYHVLAAGEDRAALILYEKYLRGTGFQILPAGSIAEAKRRIGDVRPQAILLDAAIQGGAGWNFLLELKRNEAVRDIPVYMAGEEADATRARALGADDLFVKPLNRKRLLDRLRELARSLPVQSALVVDDDEVSRYILRDLLSDTRYQVLEAATGAEALALARRRRPRVILLDLLMPGMSGYEVLERLAADRATAGIPVIIVTSQRLDERERAELSGKAAAMFSKEGTSRQDAIARIREVLTAAEVKKG